MAGVSMKAIKLRIKSMESTKQITKAMEMVAASRMRKAQERVQTCRPYYKTFYRTLRTIAANTEDFESVYLQQREVKKTCYIVIAGDRGLAGGYNSNVLKLAWADMAGKNVCVLPIGKKAAEFFRQRGTEILTPDYAEAADVSVADCFTIAKLIAGDYAAEAYDEVYIVYTNFQSVLSQTPALMQLLPLQEDPEEEAEKSDCLTLYEPDSAAVFAAIVPEYLGGLLYGALSESVASELGARRTAMDAATKNAEEMIADLDLKYNRARQGAITQEITEIVAGSEK